MSDNFVYFQVNNYAWTVHLKQALMSNSIPGNLHPDNFWDSTELLSVFIPSNGIHFQRLVLLCTDIVMNDIYITVKCLHWFPFFFNLKMKVDFIFHDCAALDEDGLRSLSSCQKWKILSDNCAASDVIRSSNQCKRRWELLLLANYRKIRKWEFISVYGLSVEKRFWPSTFLWPSSFLFHGCGYQCGSDRLKEEWFRG